MDTATRTTAVAVFENAHDAQQALRELRDAGFAEDQLGVVSRDQDRPAGTIETHDEGSKAAEGAGAGAATGAGVGALWALGIAAGMAPAIGPVIAGGVLAAVVASAAGAAAVGGLVGALIGLGIPEEEAEYYELEFRAGRTVVTVRTDGRQDEATVILNRHQGYDMPGRADRAPSDVVPPTPRPR